MMKKSSYKIIAGLTMVLVMAMSTYVISQRIAKDEYFGIIGIKAANGCSNGLCPVYSPGHEGQGKYLQGYIPADKPSVGTHQDVLDARVGVVIGTKENAATSANADSKEKNQQARNTNADSLNASLNDPSVQKAINDNKVQITDQNTVARDPKSGGVVTTSGNVLPTFETVKESLANTNSPNTQTNVNKIISDIQINAPSTSLPSNTGALSIDDKKFEYITFTCSRCGADQRCQTEIGTNPVFTFGANFSGCSQVDKRSIGSKDGWDAVKLCDTSCSGGTSSETRQEKTSTENKTSNEPTPAPTPTPTPTSPAPQCQNIKIYKDNQLISISSVSPGDHIVVAVTGTNATKGRFRFNGAPLNGETSGFTESTGTNTTGEFTLPLTVPTNVASIKIEAEVFKDGVWQ